VSYRTLLAWSTLAVLLGACTPGDERPRRGRGVLVIAMDSLRVDHFGAAGYDRNTTPTIDGLLEEGVWFSQAFSAAPGIMPAHVALLTGCDPQIARQPLPSDFGFASLSKLWRVPQAAPSLAAEFLAEGFRTAAFMDHAWLAPHYGFSRGFESFQAFSGGTPLDEHDLGAGGIGRSFYHWLNSLEKDADWFAYLTVNDLERSIRVANPAWDSFFEARAELDQIPPVVRATHAFFALADGLGAMPGLSVGEYEARYDGSLRQLDSKLKRLLAQLEAQGKRRQTTVCLIGTFGIGFGEAGLYLDHGTLENVDLHVPWILLPAEGLDISRGLRSPHLASSLDLMPTLLELYGIEVPAGVHGVSQIPALRKDGAAVREFAYSAGGLSQGFAVHDGRYSFSSTLPATRGDGALKASWYGVPEITSQRRRMTLVDRQPADPGAPLSPGISTALLARGEDWYTWIQHARDALHNPEWLDPPLSASEWTELRARDLVPPGLGPLD
jgi:arylsulfatase A-like enzyme